MHLAFLRFVHTRISLSRAAQTSTSSASGLTSHRISIITLSHCEHRIYNIKKKQEMGSLLQHDGTITTLAFCGKMHLLSGSEDGMICIWRTSDWIALKTLVGHKGCYIDCCVLHVNGDWITASLFFCSCHFLDLIDNRCLFVQVLCTV